MSKHPKPEPTSLTSIYPKGYAKTARWHAVAMVLITLLLGVYIGLLIAGTVLANIR